MFGVLNLEFDMGIEKTASAILSFIETLLDRASLWFWLTLAAAVILYLDRTQMLAQGIDDPSNTDLIKLTGVVFIALFLNAAQIHDRIMAISRNLASYMFNKVTLRFKRWEQTRADPVRIKRSLKILKYHCAERRWLVW